MENSDYVFTVDGVDSSSLIVESSSSSGNVPTIALVYIASFVITGIIISGIFIIIKKKYKHVPTWIYVLLPIAWIIFAFIIPIIIGLTMLSIHCSSPGADCA